QGATTVAILGYLLVLALAIGFLYVGVQGFSSKGLPWSRKKKLTGATAKTVGTICVILGLAILGFGIFDVIATLGPRPERTVSHSGNPPQAPLQPVPPPAQQAKPSPGKPLQGLLAYWNFDESEGSKVFDASGRGNHAILHGAKRVPGVRGNGVSLPKGEYVDYG